MKAIKEADLRDLTDAWDRNELSYSKMVELINEKADNFTIEFSEWKDKYCVYYDGWNIRVPLGDKYSDVYSNQELLEIYKKEKGL